MKILEKRIKPLYQIDDRTMVVWNRGTIGRYDLLTKRHLERINILSGVKAIAVKFRLMERLLRLEPRGIEKLSDEVFLVAFHGSILNVNFKTQRIEKEQDFSEGMNSPLSFSRIEGIDGFENGIVYGEYKGNDEKKPVSVYIRPFHPSGKWKKIYQFEAGKINHIHSILPDPYRNAVYILTGDDDASSGIWAAKDNWKDVRPLAVGKQIYRSCCALIEAEGITFVTDTPFQQNGVYFLDLTSERIAEPVMLQKIPGSCIYGTFYKDSMLFSTAVEPDARLKHMRYLLTRKRGEGIADNFVHVYFGNRKNGYRELCAVKKDGYPMGLMQFGAGQYPKNSFSVFHKAYIYFTAVKKLDGRWGEFYV